MNDKTKAWAEQCMRDANTLASKLEQLAKRIREQGQYFLVENPRHSAVYHAADITNDYTQGVGNLGCFQWNLIYAAEQFDKARREEAKSGSEEA